MLPSRDVARRDSVIFPALVVAFVAACTVADVILERNDFPVSAVAVATLVAGAFLSVRITAAVGAAVIVVGVGLAVDDYTGVGRVTRIVFFVGAALVALTVALIRTRREAEVDAGQIELARREAEVASAHKFQQALLPGRLPYGAGYEVCSRYQPAAGEQEIGGDWFDAIEADDALTLIIGDVAGRGLRAAATMATARHAIGMAALTMARPSRILEAANEYVRLFPDTMATCLVVRFDLVTGAAVAASAGHPPFVIGTGSGAALAEVPPGVPLGVADGSAYSDYPVEVPAWSTVVLYTDGLIERRRSSLDAGLTKLVELMGDGVVRSLEQVCDGLFDVFADGLADDVAVLAVRFGDQAFTGGGVDVVEFSLRPELTGLREMRERLDEWMAERDVPAKKRFDVVTAVNEAATNGILHGGLRPDQHVDIRVRLDGRHVKATVADRGGWRVRPERAARGLELIRLLMDTTMLRTSTTQGTAVILETSLNGDRP